MVRKLAHIACAFASFIVSLSLSSCAFLKTDDEMIEDKMVELINNLENSNKEGIKKMFAKTKIEKIDGFDDSIDKLFDYYNGKYVSKVNGSHGKFRDKHYEFSRTWFLPSFDVTTAIETYRIAFYLCTEYTTDRNSVGIWSLYILKKKDDPAPKYDYGGDGLWTLGINIGKVYDEKLPKGDHWELDR